MTLKSCYLSCLLIAGGIFMAYGQSSQNRSSSAIYHDLLKLNSTARVLYVAAHPDDENTRLISWLANEKLAETAYLSLTRGDGGQNLIGTEQGSYMGVIRTQELIEARKIDGGMQYFTRAVDFGYSKTADETFEKWDKKQVLADVVWVIRNFKPDVIITRFPPNSMAGHGHHAASALLAEEAFDLAADPTAFPDQLKHVTVWQPKRLYFNTSSWWVKNIDSLAQGSPDYLVVDVGTYNPLLGKWYTELAGESRSMHKSQGFGAAQNKGEQLEYLKYVKGERASSDLFDSINTTWGRTGASENLSKALSGLIANYNPFNPGASLNAYVDWYMQLHACKDFYCQAAAARAKNVIAKMAGLNFEVNAKKRAYTLGEQLQAEAVLLNQSSTAFKIKSIRTPAGVKELSAMLSQNQPLNIPIAFEVPSEVKFTQPYWLQNDYENMFAVSELLEIGKPENDAAFYVEIVAEINGKELQFKVPIEYKWVDRVEGERVAALSIAPPVVMNLDQQAYLLQPGKTKQIAVTVSAYTTINGQLRFKLPMGWKTNPEVLNIAELPAGESQTFKFELTAPYESSGGALKVVFVTQNGTYSYAEKTISYPHIRRQYLFPPASAKLNLISAQYTVDRIGYIMGAGDDVPKSLEQLGIKVDLLNPETLAATDLTQYSAIVMGIRALNTEKALATNYGLLKSYVSQGGNLIMQYCTNRDVLIDDFGPYPMRLSRLRVTEEDALPTLLAPQHALLNTPNPISIADFDGWVQERGLYFADQWDSNYTPLIAWNDKGETPAEGGLLVAHQGKGTFIYTGISFFRQLPAGVPGAYKLFLNMIHYQQQQD